MTIKKHNLMKLYVKNAVMEYLAVNCLVTLVLLLLAKVQNDSMIDGLRPVVLFLTMNTALYMLHLMANILGSLFLRHHTGTIENAFETEHGKYAITIERDGNDKRKRRTAVVHVPASSYNIYVSGRQVEYVNFLNRSYLCMF